MWRKNRNTDSFKNCTGIVDDMSNGVDLNRNFDFMWMCEYFNKTYMFCDMYNDMFQNTSK